MTLIKTEKNARISKSRISFALCSLISTALFITAIVFSNQCKKGAFDGIEYCLKILVPSLFPFMVLSSLLINCGASDFVKRKMRFITKIFPHSPPDMITVLLLCLTGGYPVGAKCISALYQSGKVTENQAERMSLWAVGAGPGFLITYVGVELLNSKKAGFILLISQSISVLILAVLCELFYKAKTENAKNEAKGAINADYDFSHAVVKSTAQGVTAIVSMCAMVVFFSSFLEIARHLLADYKFLAKCIDVFGEVTSACRLLSSNGDLTLFAFAVGFGGFCVHFQIFAFLSCVHVRKLLFFVVRIAQGVITAAAAQILFYFFPISVEVFKTVDSVNAQMSGTLWGGAALVLCGICFLLSLRFHRVI